jgi:hypothetical protein
MIERGILVFEDGVPQIKAVSVEAAPKAQSLTDTMFYEELAKKDPAIPGAIQEFLKMIEPLGVEPELKASLNLKADLPEAPRATNFGYVTKAGKLWTSTLSWTAPEHVARQYNETLAKLIDGKVATQDSIYLSTNGTSPPLISALLPAHAEAWAEAIKQAIDGIRATQAEAAE